MWSACIKLLYMYFKINLLIYVHRKRKLEIENFKTHHGVSFIVLGSLGGLKGVLSLRDTAIFNIFVQTSAINYDIA